MMISSLFDNKHAFLSIIIFEGFLLQTQKHELLLFSPQKITSFTLHDKCDVTSK